VNILGIETSCDDTSVAICDSQFRIHNQITKNQDELHARFGGVVPEIASRHHFEHLRTLIQDVDFEAIDAIAVTQGPGLMGSLLVGNAFAKGLAFAGPYNLIPINHLDAHLASVFCDTDLYQRLDQVYPSLSLVISGGHTLLYLQKSPLDAKLLATTQDDACGECFDKVAKQLGLGFPGGKKIEELAQKGDEDSIKMPKIMHNAEHFSYSGLKTHTLQLINSGQYRIEDICACFQKAAFAQIVQRLKAALVENPTSKSVFIVGGVSANQYLKKQLQSSLDLAIFAPLLQYCTDNAGMVAAAAQLRLENVYERSQLHCSYTVFSRSE
jgi:N6-L-threonylcarbamoyladenine synthase